MNPIQVEFEDINKPYSEGEIKERIRKGWHIAGQVLVSHGSGLSTPNNPDGKVGVAPCHVWVANTMAIPAAQVAAIVVQSESKDELVQNLFGMPLDQLEQQMQEVLE